MKHLDDAEDDQEVKAENKFMEIEKTFCSIDDSGQFHQHLMSSFYACRSQIHKKDSQVKQLFALLGLVRVKCW